MLILQNLITDKIMTDLERGYIAGLFDGEGTISLSIWKRDENVMGFRLGPNVCIYNSDLSLLIRAREVMGNGLITEHLPSKKVKNNKLVAKVSLGANQCRHVLPQILDVLASKKAQAELVLKYLDLAPSGPKNSHLFEEFIDILWKLRTLNMRGLGSVSKDDVRNRLTSIKEARSNS
jgi:hypothetical protein